MESLAGFERFAFTDAGLSHDVYRAGAGPAVIVIHELPALHPGVVEFAQRLIAAGYTTYLPSLIGRAGEPHTGTAILRTVARACVVRELAVRDAAPDAGRGVRECRDRFVVREPTRHSPEGSLGADGRPRRRARAPQ
ncbi:hypothetical protein WEI85_44285 [Actinomycetes bacterium KLBMP 9797]